MGNPGSKEGRRSASLVTLVSFLLAVGMLGSSCSSSSSAMPTVGPAVLINGASQGWTFHDGQTVTVAVGPNKVLTPHLRLLILECSDPGGMKSSLPSHAAEHCDVDTVQANTVIPQANGSFTATGYIVFQLPSKALNEGPTWVPVCNKTHPCVLYVGDDYNDFTKPKVFSNPFTIAGSSS